MKVAFYLPNKNCNSDCTEVDKGNPGIGGTEYMIIAMAYHLMICQDIHKITVLAQNDQRLPRQCCVKKVQNVLKAVSFCKEDDIDCLIVQNSPETNSLFQEKLGDLKLIIWAHSFMSRKQWNLYANSANVKRIVCVGNEELELYCDHRAFKKSTVIFNAFPIPSDKPNLLEFSKRKDEVTFLASIVPHTHFDMLARVWKKVLLSIPNAHLNVIGTGNLYNNNDVLGKYHIAQEKYEQSFIQYLLDDEGRILPSVTFWGRLGKEKYDILEKTKVGVVNPGGYETFCISAVEMQLYGAKVVSCRKGGLLDTVYEVGNLFVSEDDFADYIVNALRAKEYDYERAFLFLKNKFSFEVICQEWEKLLDEVDKDTPLKQHIVGSKFTTKLHRLRYANKKMKSIIPYGFYWMPCMKFYETFWDRFKCMFL